MATFEDSVARTVHHLADRAETVAVAESITGGRLAAAITAVPGSSEVFVGGVVSYATEVKVGVLGVPREVVEGPGVVSAECALAMARGVARLLGTTYALATTGVAGPGPSEGHPAGTVWAAVAGPGTGHASLLRLGGDRWQVLEQATRRALELLAGEVGGLR